MLLSLLAILFRDKKKGGDIVMNINPEKVKELVLIYSELDENYQKELMKQAYALQLKQTQLNEIKKEKLQFKTEFELQEEVDKRAAKRAEGIMDILEVLKKADDTDKAALFMVVNQLAGKGNIVKESDITITVNRNAMSMKDYLEKYLFDVDYDKAKEKAIKFMSESKDGDKNE